MAASLQFSVASSTKTTAPIYSQPKSLPSNRRLFSFPSKATALIKLTFNSNKHHRFFDVKAIEESKENAEQESVTEVEAPESDESELSAIGAEIKAAMKERAAAKNDNGIAGGVAEEIREIEWPAFRKVVGTTGVVLGVIAGSSVVLLTVNAVLAEFSDKIFAGKGVQDFFT